MAYAASVTRPAKPRILKARWMPLAPVVGGQAWGGEGGVGTCFPGKWAKRAHPRRDGAQPAKGQAKRRARVVPTPPLAPHALAPPHHRRDPVTATFSDEMVDFGWPDEQPRNHCRC